jgi:O-antigen biosynthesis protein
MESSFSPNSMRMNTSCSGPFNLNNKLKSIVSFAKLRGQSLEVSGLDWRFYVEYYDDLNTLSSYEAACEHWILFGQIEDRFPNQDALKHYFEQKQTELPEDFDDQCYLELNLDLQEKFALNPYKKYKAIEHFLQHGQYEGRAYQTSFDWKFYLEYNDDLTQLANREDAYEHWLMFGQQEGRFASVDELMDAIQQQQINLPANFQPELYLALNPDLQQRLLHPNTHHRYIKYKAIEHFLQHGRSEGRPYEQVVNWLEPQSAGIVTDRPSPSSLSTDYDCWIEQNTPSEAEIKHLAEAALALRYKPLISILMPTYNTPETFLREAIESVLAQAYPDWELCIADDASTEPHVKPILEEYAAKDCRIKVECRRVNGHISVASNSALSLATGEFVALLDHDDRLAANALYEVALLLNDHPDADMIYSDEDKLNEQGKRVYPYFKPDWCPDSFLSRMYTCHLGVYRRSLLNLIRGFRVGFEGSQDYDLVLRITERTTKIYHLPKILYHWRVHAGSVTGGAAAKPYAYEAAKKALAEALHRRGEAGTIQDIANLTGHYTIRYQIVEAGLVSIIIPTRDMAKILDVCLASIFTKSTYPNYEVIVIDNGSVEQETFAVLEKWRTQEPKRFQSYRYNIPFNYSKINNYGVNKAKGDYLLFLNNDTEVITPDWIEAMVEQAQRNSIGAVGALLLYPDQTIQHAGVVLGLGGLAAHGHQHFPADTFGYAGQVISTSNVTAVTGACLMCQRQVFEAVNGFDEVLAVAYNDVDLCLKIIDAGYQNIYLPHVKLYHHESKSRGYEDTPEKQARWQREADILIERWQRFIQHDPCYSPNLTRSRADYSIRMNGALVEVVDIVLSEHTPDLFWGVAIDSPTLHGKYDSSYFLIAGWIIGKQLPVLVIEVLKDDQLLCIIPVNQTRLDVAQVYAGMPAAKNSGFMAKLELANSKSEQQEFQLRAVFTNFSKVALGTLTLMMGATNARN